MSRPYQVPLSIELPLIQDLNNFVVGKNTELVKLVTRSPKRFTGVWLHGPAGAVAPTCCEPVAARSPNKSLTSTPQTLNLVPSHIPAPMPR